LSISIRDLVTWVHERRGLKYPATRSLTSASNSCDAPSRVRCCGPNGCPKSPDRCPCASRSPLAARRSTSKQQTCGQVVKAESRLPGQNRFPCNGSVTLAWRTRPRRERAPEISSSCQPLVCARRCGGVTPLERAPGLADVLCGGAPGGWLRFVRCTVYSRRQTIRHADSRGQQAFVCVIATAARVSVLWRRLVCKLRPAIL